MDASPEFRSLDDLAALLPFELLDTSAANALYVRYSEHGTAHERRLVDVWTYCYIRRYYLVKIIQQSHYSVADLDRLTSKVYQRVLEKREALTSNTRYANWVSVVCKNSYINYLRQQQRTPEVFEEEWMPGVTLNDPGLVLQVVLAAIARLPEFLREVARLRLVEEYSYEEIADITGRDLPTLRAYANKAVKRLRVDPAIRELADLDPA